MITPREKENVIEVLQKIQNDYIIYDGYYPQCTEEWYVLDEAIKELKKETVPREVYEHEYTLRKNLETEILHLKRIINNLWTPVDEALPKRDERTQNLSEDVQVTIKDEFGFTVDVAYYDYQEKKWQSEMLDDCAKVLAWKPLPQPYRNDLCDTNPFNNKFGS